MSQHQFRLTGINSYLRKVTLTHSDDYNEAVHLAHGYLAAMSEVYIEALWEKDANHYEPILDAQTIRSEYLRLEREEKEASEKAPVAPEPELTVVQPSVAPKITLASALKEIEQEQEQVLVAPGLVTATPVPAPAGQASYVDTLNELGKLALEKKDEPAAAPCYDREAPGCVHLNWCKPEPAAVESAKGKEPAVPRSPFAEDQPDLKQFVTFAPSLDVAEFWAMVLRANGVNVLGIVPSGTGMFMVNHLHSREAMDARDKASITTPAAGMVRSCRIGLCACIPDFPEPRKSSVKGSTSPDLLTDETIVSQIRDLSRRRLESFLNSSLPPGTCLRQVDIEASTKHIANQSLATMQQLISKSYDEIGRGLDRVAKSNRTPTHVLSDAISRTIAVSALDQEKKAYYY